MINPQYATELVDDGEFAFTTGSVRVLETRLLTGAQLGRMAEATDAAEAWRMLADAGATKASEISWQNYEEALAKELQELYRYVGLVSPKPELTNWLAHRYDFHNLKVFLKARFLTEDPTEAVFDVGLVPAKLIEQAVKTEVWKALPEELAKAGERAALEYASTKSVQAFDIVVDRQMYAYLKAASCHPFLHALVDMWCDLINLKTALRARVLAKEKEFFNKALMGPGALSFDRLLSLFEAPLENWAEELRNTQYSNFIAQALARWGDELVAHLDKLSDDFVLERLSAAKLALYGVEPLVSYVLAKETELKNIRIIMVGKINGLSVEALKERIRASYV